MYTLAIPSNDRMQADALKSLRGAGLTFNRSNRVLIAPCPQVVNLQAAFLDYKDIARFVGTGQIDFGITTTAALEEQGGEAQTVKLLDFSHCRVVFAALASAESLDGWQGKVVASKYPNLTTQFFKEAGRKDVRVMPVSGSSEVYVPLRLAQGIVDIVQSGESLQANGLRELATLMPVQAVLIASPRGLSAAGQQLQSRLRCAV